MDASDGEVYRKYSDDLVRFATGLVGPSDAADVVGEAVLHCIASPKWRSVDRKKPYLYRSVFNEAKRFHRSNSRRLSRELQAAKPDKEDPPELRPEILAAVGALSVQQRAVIFLTYWEDLSPLGVSSALGIGEGSVKRHLNRARRRLKEVLNAND